MEENHRQYALAYASQLQKLAEFFQADTGEEVKEACLFFVAFKERDKAFTEDEKQIFASELGLAHYTQVLNNLQNVVFDYVERCIEGAFAPLLFPLIAYLDREEAAFLAHMEELVRKYPQHEEVEKSWAESRKEYASESSTPFEISFDIPYRKKASEAQCLDFYRPTSAGEKERLPLILYFHGGAWAYGRRFKGVKRLRHLADTGYAVASCGYRLIREASWPAQIEDCQAVLHYVRENAEVLGIDPARIIVWGSSAGAHLGGVLCGQEKVEKVKGFVNMCGPMDVESHVANVQGSMRELSPIMQLLGGEGAELKTFAAQANVMNFMSPQFPSTLIVHGEKDDTVPISESETLHAVLLENQVDVEFLRLPEFSHRMDDTVVMPRIKGFLERMASE